MIDLFAGCGGISQGFRATGQFESVAAVEHDRDAAATYAANFGDHVSVADIADWVRGSIPRAEVVVGGPPCQGFSALGRQDEADPRNQMWRHYVTTLRLVRPAVFVMENVPQFLNSVEFTLLQRMTRKRGDLENYALEAHILNSADYGAPQARRRAVVIGRLRDLKEFGAPEPLENRRTVRDALQGTLDPYVERTTLPQSWVEFKGMQVPGEFKLHDLHITRKPTELSLARYRAIPAGGSRKDLPDALLAPCWRKHKTGAGDVMGRLSWDKPSVTIRTEFYKPEKGRYLHPDQDRPITHAEAALLQGFDDDFKWCGTKVSIARQIGNAVPPRLAEALGRHLATRIH